MTIRRSDHVSVEVDDLPAAVDFFTELGLAKEGEMPIEGDRVDRINGIEGNGVLSRHFRVSLCQPEITAFAARRPETTAPSMLQMWDCLV